MDPCAEPVTEYAGLPALKEWLQEHLDVELWDRHVQEHQRQRSQGAGGAIEGAVETAIRAAAAATGAIEGLYPITTGQTIKVAERAPDWQDELAATGENSLALFEAQLGAYHLATSLAFSDTGWAASGVRQLHKEICRPEAERDPTLSLGEYKVRDNCTRKSDGKIHRYARARDIAPEVDHLLEVTRSSVFEEAHPVVQAAYVHFGLAAIHPFSDGNGRVARAVGSAVLQRRLGLPLIIYADQRDRYLLALERTDINDYGPFLRFIFDRCLDSMRFVADRLAMAQTPGPDEFERLYAAQAGLSFQEVTNLADKVTNDMYNVFNEAFLARHLPGTIGFTSGGYQRGGVSQSSFGSKFRGTNAEVTNGFLLNLASAVPAQANLQITYGVFIARDIAERFPLVIANWDSPNDTFEIRLDDVLPNETTDFVVRRRAWVEHKLSEALNRLYEMAKASRGP